MPTDLDATDMSGVDRPASPPHRNQVPALRLAIGVSATFVIGMILQWPFAFLAAVLASMSLQQPAAPGLRGSVRLVAIAFVMLITGYILFSALMPYRTAFTAAQILLLIWSFSLSVRGKPSLLVVLALMESVMMPFLVHLSRDLAGAFAIWLPANLAIALLATWASFALFPAPPVPRRRARPAADTPAFDPDRRLVRMMVVTTPFVLGFFYLDGGAVITLLFVAILTHQLAASTADGLKVARMMLLANLAGGLAAIVASELVVMNTNLAFMVVVTLLLCFTLSAWLYSGRPSAALAGSALSTALILFGGVMAPSGGEADVKMLDRLVQIAAAIAWVLGSFVAVDRFLPEREPGAPVPHWRQARRKRRQAIR